MLHFPGHTDTHEQVQETLPLLDKLKVLLDSIGEKAKSSFDALQGKMGGAREEFCGIRGEISGVREEIDRLHGIFDGINKKLDALLGSVQDRSNS